MCINLLFLLNFYSFLCSILLLSIYSLTASSELICTIHSFELQILSKYVSLVDNLENRLKLATKFKCHEVAIEVCCP